MDVAESYRFCPRCGSEREHFKPARPFHCLSCGHTSYFGPVAAVAGIVTNRFGQVLMLVRAKYPGKGMLGLPGGFVDANESAEEALKREVFEEVGLKIDNLQFLVTVPNRYRYQEVEYPVLDIFYFARFDEEQTVAPEQSEVADWLWADLTEDNLSKMAFLSNRKAVEFFLQSQQI